MNIIERYLTVNQYSRPGVRMTAVKGLVVHYVGNAGSSANGNRNYFESLKNGSGIYASSQFIIGLSGEIIACMPENELAYHAGNGGYNSSYIGIECCHPDAGGKFNEKTYGALIELAAYLCRKYGFGTGSVIRHYDVTGKKCPLWYVNNSGDWKQLKADLLKAINGADAEKKEADEEVVEKRNVCFNGKWIEADAIIKNSETFVRVRALEGAGVHVGYEPESKAVLLDTPPAERVYRVDGEEIAMDTVMVRDKNYVGVRELEKIGCVIGYDSLLKMASIELP